MPRSFAPHLTRFKYKRYPGSWDTNHQSALLNSGDKDKKLKKELINGKDYEKTWCLTRHKETWLRDLKDMDFHASLRWKLPESTAIRMRWAWILFRKLLTKTQSEIIAWFQSLGISNGPANRGMDGFQEWLKSGHILCDLMNSLAPGSIRKVNNTEKVKMAVSRKNC